MGRNPPYKYRVAAKTRMEEGSPRLSFTDLTKKGDIVRKTSLIKFVGTVFVAVGVSGCAFGGGVHPAAMKDRLTGKVTETHRVTIDGELSERLCKIEKTRGGDACLKSFGFPSPFSDFNGKEACRMKIKDERGRVFEGISPFCYPPGEKVVFSYDAEYGVLRNVRSWE